MKKIKLQLLFFVVQFINTTSRFLISFRLRRAFLGLFGIKVGRLSAVHAKVKFFHFGNLRIGKNSTINNGCYIDNRRSVVIGDNVNISHDTKIYTLGHDINSPDFKAVGKGVTINNYACIFSNAIICPGVNIGKGAVIYPGSVVVKDVGDFEVVGGNPAKFIKFRSRDLTYKINYNYWFAI